MAHFLFWASAGSIVGMSLHMFYTTVKEHFESQSNFRKWAIDEVSKQRRIVLRQKRREKIHSISRAIEAKTKTYAYAVPSEPPNTGRPYGLPPEWSESGREHIWRLILKHVDEPNDVIKLSEMCPLFQWLLRGKYKAAKLAEVYKVSLANSRRDVAPQRCTNDLLALRLVCETTRKSVDEMLTKPRPCNTAYTHHYLYLGPASIFLPSRMPAGVRSLHVVPPRQLATVPLLEDFLLGMQRQIHVPEVTKSLLEKRIAPFRTRTLYLNHIFLNEVDLDNLPEVRASFTKLFKLAGECISSILYFTEQSAHDTYETLRKWIPHLANLKELRLSRKRLENEVIANLIAPFPPALNLTGFLEMNAGLPVQYLTEILRVTPALKHIELSHFPENRLDVLVNGGVLDPLPLEIFLCGQAISVPFLKREFKWPLKTIAFVGMPHYHVTGRNLMNFVNQFGATLEEFISEIYVDKSSGMLNLPRLTKLKWLQHPDVENFEFLNPLQNLEELEINAWRNIPGMLTKEEIMAHLKKHNVPTLFPALKKIRSLLKEGDTFTWVEVWVKGDDVGF